MVAGGWKISIKTDEFWGSDGYMILFSEKKNFIQSYWKRTTAIEICFWSV